MKIKGVISLLVLLLIIFPMTSAVEFNLNPAYKSGETIITKISGNFLSSLAKENIFFYKEHVRVPVDYGIEKINKEYYLYASLEGKTEGNYSISVKNVQYMNGAETLSDDLVRNFSITNETADFSLKPGAIVSAGKFSLEIQNLKDEQLSIMVTTKIANGSERDISVVAGETTAKLISVSLVSGESGKIYFESGEGFPTFQKIKLSSANLTYEVPVYIFSSAIFSEDSYKIEPPEIISSIPSEKITKRTIFIYNSGDTEIENISMSLSDSISSFVNVSPAHVDSLAPNTNLPLELSFFSPGEIEASGTLKVNINGETMLYSQISLKFLRDFVPANDSQQSSVKTCGELTGKICKSGEACDSQIVYAKDNVCCLGNCVSTKEKSPWGTIIGFAIFFILVVVGLWFYKTKYKKAGKPVNLLDIARGKN